MTAGNQHKPSIVPCSLVCGAFSPELDGNDRDYIRSLLIQSASQNEQKHRIELHESVQAIVVSRLHDSVSAVMDHHCLGGIYFHKQDEKLSIAAKLVSPTQGAQQALSPLDKFIADLHGSWSLVSVDERRVRLTLARDAAGAQTMYFASRNGVIWFSSTLSLFRLLAFPLSKKSIGFFLHFLYIPAPRTIYEDVSAVLPGQAVTWEKGVCKKEQISFPDFLQTTGQNNIKQGSDNFVEGFEVSLQRALRRTVPLSGKSALFLSGGKDSSTLAIGAKLAGISNLEALTLGFAERSVDESNDAELVSKHLGLPFRSLIFSCEDYRRMWTDYIASLDQPHGDPAGMPVYAALANCGQEYARWLDGTGNDGYLGVTTTWQLDLVWRIHRFLPGLHHIPWRLLPDLNSYSLRLMADLLSKPREEQFVSWRGWTPLEIQKLLGVDPVWSETPLYGVYSRSHKPLLHRTLTTRIWETHTAFRKVVQTTNFFGVPVSYPFLDMELMDYCSRLPADMKYDGRINKIIIRRLLEKHLPSQIVHKKKGSFDFPRNYLLDHNGFEMINSFLNQDSIRRRGILDDSLLWHFCKRYMAGEKDLEDRIWALFVLACWLECHA